MSLKLSLTPFLSQAAGSMLGVSSFSWRQVAADGITAGLTAGIGAGLQGVGAFTRGAEAGQQLNRYGQMAQAVGSYGASVVGREATGLNTQFSWNAVAAAAVGAAISVNTGGRAPILKGGSPAAGFGGLYVNSAANATAGRMFGLGEQDWGDIALDAFGNALGNAIVRNSSRAPASLEDTQNLETSASEMTDWGAFTPNLMMDDGASSFLDRYPYATASLQNGDVGRSNAINVNAAKLESPYVVGAKVDGATNLAPVVVTGDPATDAWYMGLWDWSNRYHQAPPPTSGNREAMVRYWSDNTERLAPTYDAYMQQAYAGRTVSSGQSPIVEGQSDIRDLQAFGRVGRGFLKGAINTVFEALQAPVLSSPLVSLPYALTHDGEMPHGWVPFEITDPAEVIGNVGFAATSVVALPNAALETAGAIGASRSATVVTRLEWVVGEEGIVADSTALIGNSGYRSIDEFADAATAKYQALYDQGYVIAQQQVARGVIPNTNRAMGSVTDEFARVGLRDWVTRIEGLQEGPGQIIQVNRRLYDPLGSRSYRVPDVHIPGARTILDGSLSFKTATTPQVVDFAAFSGGSRTTIIAPYGLRWGSYGIVP